MRVFVILGISVLFLVMHTQIAAQEIGRLFSTPAERVELDRLRSKVKPGEKLPEVAAVKNTPEEAPVVVDRFSVDGFVKRSSGKDTTWVNQQPQSVKQSSRNIIVQQQLSKPPLVSITLPTGKRLKLKAGQTVDVESGKIRDVYEPIPAVEKIKKE
jgi:hypothetical protein